MPRTRGQCSVEECDLPHFGHGLCYRHWRRWTRNGTLERLIGEHGQTDSPEYRSWTHMRKRCNDPANEAYKSYGGRGIMVCAEWSSFERFLADMGPRPSLAHSIDRIDNQGNYEPGNCRWATQGEQNRNKRTNVWLTFDGRTQIMQDWAKELGIPYTTIYQRLQRGLPIEAAFQTEYRRRRPRASSA